MSAWQESSDTSPDCVAVVEEFVRPLPRADLVVLRIQLKVLQNRLGTVDEQPCDIDLARVLGHEINNRLTALQLQRDLARLDDPPARFPS
jgi:hypothetical protein